MVMEGLRAAELVLPVTTMAEENGTYVNRERVDSRRLEDGDELQIGKYKLTFLER